MEIASQEYKGFTIEVTPLKDCEDRWDFSYRIQRAGQGTAAVDITRSQTDGGHANPEIACVAGIEVARTEIDNLLAKGST